MNSSACAHWIVLLIRAEKQRSRIDNKHKGNLICGRNTEASAESLRSFFLSHVDVEEKFVSLAQTIGKGAYEAF